MGLSVEIERDTRESRSVDRKRPPRIDALDGVRGVAALYVVIHHAYVKLYEPSAAYASSLGFLQYGIISVSVFIVLSGFCLALPVIANGGYLRGGYLQFLKRRARRILPAYYATLLLGTLIRCLQTGSPFGQHDTHDGALSLLRHALLLHNVWGNTDNSVYGDHLTNGVMWSIAVEFQIYLWFPVFVAMARRLTPFGALLIVSAVAAVLQARVVGTPWNGLNCPYYALFCAGMFAAALAGRSAAWTTRARRAVTCAPIVSFVALAGFILSTGLHWIDSHIAVTQVVTGIFGFFLVLAVASIPRWDSLFSTPKLVNLGSFSYSLYLTHMPLLALWFTAVIVPIYARVGSLLSFIVTLSFGLPMILYIAYRFSLLFEQPFMNNGAIDKVQVIKKNS